MNPYAQHPSGPIEPFASLWRHRVSPVGIAWSFFNPVLARPRSRGNPAC